MNYEQKFFDCPSDDLCFFLSCWHWRIAKKNNTRRVPTHEENTEEPQLQPIANNVRADAPSADAEPPKPPMPSPAKALSADAEVVPRLRKRNTPQWKHVVQALHVLQRPRPKTKHQKRELTNQDDEYYGELSGIYFQRSCVDAAVRVDAYLACQELHGKNTKTGPVHCQVHCFFSGVESKV